MFLKTTIWNTRFRVINLDKLGVPARLFRKKLEFISGQVGSPSKVAG